MYSRLLSVFALVLVVFTSALVALGTTAMAQTPTDHAHVSCVDPACVWVNVEGPVEARRMTDLDAPTGGPDVGWQRLVPDDQPVQVKTEGEVMISAFRVTVTATTRTQYLFVVDYTVAHEAIFREAISNTLAVLDDPLDHDDFGLVFVNPARAGAGLACALGAGRFLISCIDRLVSGPPVALPDGPIDAGLDVARATFKDRGDPNAGHVAIVFDDFRSAGPPEDLFLTERTDCENSAGNPLFCAVYRLKQAGAIVAPICRGCDEQAFGLVEYLGGEQYTAQFSPVETLGHRIDAMRQLPPMGAEAGMILAFPEVANGTVTGASTNCDFDTADPTSVGPCQLGSGPTGGFAIGSKAGRGLGEMPWAQIIAWAGVYVPDPAGEPGLFRLRAPFEIGASRAFVLPPPPSPPPPVFTPSPTATTAPTATATPTDTNPVEQCKGGPCPVYLPRLVRAVPPR